MGPKAIIIVLGVVTLTVGIIMGDVIVGVAGSEQVNTGSYLRAACGGTNIAIRFPGQLEENVAFSAAQLQNLSGKASCTAISATDRKSSANGVC